MARFDPDLYRRYRPYYPAALFEELPKLLLARSFSEPFEIVDLGCGTGHSSASLLKSGIRARVRGIDPDAAMLDRAREVTADLSVDFSIGQGELTGLESESADAAIVASALHWMEPQATCTEIGRILKPRGILQVFEYQFPKCAELPELNEWIRREFNLRWKAPQQKPRGDLFELTRLYRATPWKSLDPAGSPRRVKMNLSLRAEDLVGLILSQSRVLHYENTLEAQQITAFRSDLEKQIQSHLRDQAREFDFNLNSALFERG